MDWSIGYVSIPLGDVTISGPLLSGTLLPEWSFLGIEILVYVFAYLCLKDAMRQGRAYAAAFFATIFFTFVVESLLSADKTVYEYPSQAFLLQVINVPIWVPIGWAFILHVAMGTSTLLGAPIFTAALIDAFLALNLDLTLDPIAIHRGWWTWNVRDNPDLYPYFVDYFGIPLINFMGWFVIVFAFSFFVRLARKRVPPGSKGTAGDIIPPFLATIPALLVVFQYQEIGLWLMQQPNLLLNGGFLSCVVWGICAAIVLWHVRAFRHDAPFKRLFIATPLVFHGYMLVLLFLTRAKDIPPAEGGEWLWVTIAELTIFFPVVAALGLCLYVWPYRDDLEVPGPASEVQRT
jgi:uncharacterized membrane protein